MSYPHLLDNKLETYREDHNDLPYHMSNDEIEHQNYHVEDHIFDPKCAYCQEEKCLTCKGSGMTDDCSDVCRVCRGRGRTEQP